MIGRHVGPYVILRPIGAGGMGAVFLAARADHEFEKQVAIKLVLRGAESVEILDRFRQERQTLASLVHPNIVRLLDGGTTDSGRPYLVMDYVEGEPLLDYCQGRRLALGDRLRLFLQISDAVQYAHQHLVVHRDIKPANVLVTADGMPRLLDFGIAKVLRPGAETHERSPMSLRYASPEQILGKPVTVATDVYSLGLLLYELLTGRYPYPLQEASEVALAYAVTQAAPAPTNLDADLDAILQVALRKDPLARYASAERMASDIRSYLSDWPVAARPPTPGYLARKFFDRHRGAVLAVALAVVATLVGFVGIAWQAQVAQRERNRAEQRFKDIHELANSFLFEFEESIRDLAGSTPARMLVVKKATQYLDRLGRDAAGDAELELELVEAYFKLGDLQGNPYSSNLGDPPGALATYRKALAICERLVKAEPGNRRSRRYLARCYRQLADVLPSLGEAPAALDYARKASATFEDLASAHPSDLQPRIDAASSAEGLGDLLARGGQREEALKAFRASLAHWQAALNIDQTNRRSQRAAGILGMKIADLHAERGEKDAALENYGQARQVLEAFSAADPSSASARRMVAVLYRKMAGALVEFGDTPAGLDRYRESAAILDALAAADPSNAQARIDLAGSLKGMGETQQSAGDIGGALKNFSRVIDIVEALSLADPSNLERRSQLAETQVIVGGLLDRSGQQTNALRMTSLGLTALKQLADRPSAAASDFNLYALSLVTCEPASAQNPKMALPYAERAVELTKSADPTVLDTLALAAWRNGDPARAVATAEKALALVPTASRTRSIIEAHLSEFRKNP
jgi:tetratricopeptide (TPR) repeat protein